MQNVYSVGQINAYIRNMFAQDFLLQNLSVKGEVSNLKYHSSGHIYFTLKDDKGTISCIMFAGNRSGLAFRLEEGMQIVVTGTVDVYERDGKYQLYAKSIEQTGNGDLFIRFERLKKELEERGMFAPEYKSPIPAYCRTLGVVTAPTGAAVRDIINIAQRRNPYVQILLYPAIVQGDAAPASIINGIRALEERQVDVMIVGRGGGSIEDLRAFNEECVAQAIFDCSVPVISAVGHETDTTIADYVADLRAPTPSAAAELAVYDVNSVLQAMQESKARLNLLMKNRLEWNRLRLQNYRTGMQAASPLGRIREKKTRLLNLEEGLTRGMENRLLKKKHQLELYIEKLKGLSPLDKLNQGFSFVADMEGKCVTSPRQVTADEELQIYLKHGKIYAKVTGWDTDVNYRERE